jgi:aminomethyltransferase
LVDITTKKPGSSPGFFFVMTQMEFDKAGIPAHNLYLPTGTFWRGVKVQLEDDLQRQTGMAARPDIVYLRGGSSVSLPLHPGDHVTVRDEQGGQACDITFNGAAPRRVIGDACAAGSGFAWTAETEGAVIITAPGAPMLPHEQNPPTDLRLAVTRRVKTPPPPLAAVKAEILVRAATAAAYTVQEGDYIQIIDLDGQQCSDFLAFDASAPEHGLDATATRTLGGRIYPGPGLHARFFDDRMQAFVEVIRDTCGRHDTFAFACSAKSYADAGYPGHANCSDNFNLALAPHGIAPRVAWPAINFFYNTQVAPCGTITADESWSRPGDYVLLRAMRDLLCANSSCADDVFTTNGYNPTDILIRIYDKSEVFSKGIAQRMTADAEPRLTRESGFHPATATLTRHFIESNGFWLPESFTASGAVAEYTACREDVALIDLSMLRKFEVTGPDAENLLALALTRNVRKLSLGQVVYTALCYEHGGMIDDGTVMRLGANNFRLICGSDYSGVWLRELAAKHGFRAFVRSSTDQLHNVSLQGPRSRALLAPLIFTPPAQPGIAELKWFRFTIGRLGGPEGVPLVISRTGYTGELGYELWVHPSQAVTLWTALTAAGAQPMGLAALDMLRIEAGLILAGREFSDETDPYEAGIGFAVADREEDFIGRDALRRRAANPLRQLVGLEINAGEAVNHGDCVHIGRAQIGVVTSATRSPVLHRSIALARIDAHHAALGTRVEIGKLDGQQRRLPATIVRFPHYDPDKTRVRG